MEYRSEWHRASEKLREAGKLCVDKNRCLLSQKGKFTILPENKEFEDIVLAIDYLEKV